MDKRLAADGRGLQQLHISENFAKLAEALYIADRKARDAVEMRAQLEKKLAQKEKEKKEDHLRQLAQKAREERAGIRSAAAVGKYRKIVLFGTRRCFKIFSCYGSFLIVYVITFQLTYR